MQRSFTRMTVPRRQENNITSFFKLELLYSFGKIYVYICAKSHILRKIIFEKKNKCFKSKTIRIIFFFIEQLSELKKKIESKSEQNSKKQFKENYHS